MLVLFALEAFLFETAYNLSFTDASLLADISGMKAGVSDDDNTTKYCQRRLILERIIDSTINLTISEYFMLIDDSNQPCCLMDVDIRLILELLIAIPLKNLEYSLKEWFFIQFKTREH